MREQDGWDEHASFMDSLAEEGFIVLGGPLAGDREILHVISAPSEEAVRLRLAEDNWHQNGMLTILSIEPGRFCSTAGASRSGQEAYTRGGRVKPLSLRGWLRARRSRQSPR